MHAAPAVTYPVGRPRLYTSVFVFLWTAVAVVLTAFGSLPQVSWQAFFAVAATGAGGFSVAWRGWRRCPTGRLSWDGLRWWWSDGMAAAVPQEGRVRPVLDLQQLLLVCFVPMGAGRIRWLWVQRPSAPPAWGLLRCAVMQPARTVGGPDREPATP